MNIIFIFKDETIQEEQEQETLVQIRLLKGEKGADGRDGVNRHKPELTGKMVKTA